MIIRNGSWEECIHMNIVVRGSGLTGAQGTLFKKSFTQHGNEC